MQQSVPVMSFFAGPLKWSRFLVMADSANRLPEDDSPPENLPSHPLATFYAVVAGP
jgi:hypothetical protein